MQAPNNGLIATEHSAGRGGSSLNQVPAGRNSSLSTCIIAAVNTWWEKRTAIDRACTAAEDARDAAAFPNSRAKGQRGARVRHGTLSADALSHDPEHPHLPARPRTP